MAEGSWAVNRAGGNRGKGIRRAAICVWVFLERWLDRIGARFLRHTAPQNGEGTRESVPVVMERDARDSELAAPTTQEPRSRLPRVFLALDEANVRINVRQGAQLDYHALIACARLLGELTCTAAYVPYRGRGNKQAARQKFKRFGFSRVIPRIGHQLRDGRVKSDLDTVIIMDLWQAALNGQVDVAVLISGDSDFVPLVQGLKRRGVEVFVIGPDGHTSPDLISAASEFCYISQVPGFVRRGAPRAFPGYPYELAA